MPALVLDASVALSWIFDRTSTAESAISQRALDFVEANGALAPSIWYYEVTNALLLGERRNIRTAAETTRFLSELIRLEITVDALPAGQIFPSIHFLAQQYGLTAYDASYLELTIRSGSTLATFDRKLAEAARSAGIPLFGDPS